MAGSIRLTIDHISKAFPVGKNETLKVIDDLSFDVADNEFLVLLGPGHCGKSVTLNITAGLEKADAGMVRLDGEIIDRPSPKMGMVFQKVGIFPWLTVLENVELGPRFKGEHKAERRKRAEKFIRIVGLQGFESSYPAQLSGGMKQRAALIRTLALEPQLLLLDEPFSALDYQTRLFVSADICRLIRAAGKTMIIITHDLSEAISLADRVIVLSGRPAVIKNEMKISLTLADDSPLAARNAPEFQQYFNRLWEDLTHENKKE